jgi:hypothetical protein
MRCLEILSVEVTSQLGAWEDHGPSDDRPIVRRRTRARAPTDCSFDGGPFTR